jgi:hypothetical protein
MTTDELAVLRRLVGLMLATPPASAWEELRAGGYLRTAAATFFLLDVEPDGGVERFMTHTVNRLLQHLLHRTEQHLVESKGRVRGKIIWPATYKARYGQDYDPARMVSRAVRYEFDIPENQLFKGVVERIQSSLLAVPAALRNGVCYRPHPEDQNTRAVALRLSNIEAGLKQVRRSVYLQAITLPPQINDMHLQRAAVADLDEYRHLVRLYQHHEMLVTRPSPALLSAASKRILPLPAQLEPGSEPWLRLSAQLLRG